jgi:2-hydroxy-3-keto-5-methylthiopentenyl-1-phosphate phosphatase
MSTAQPLHVFLDFDGTLTTADTTEKLVGLGYSHNQQHSTDVREWEEIVAAYMEDMEHHVVTYEPQAEQRRSIEEECAFLASLKEIEQRSVHRVETAGIFRGMTVKDIDEYALEEVQSGGVLFREGWDTLLALVHRDGGSIGLISANWSAVWIRQCLYHASRVDVRDVLKNLRVYANELVKLDKPGGASGETTKKADIVISTSHDKARVLRERRQEIGDGVILYVGDSSTDLEALTTADIGIIIRNDSIKSGHKELADICERLQIPVRSIDKFVQNQKNNCLWWARDFEHILQCRLFHQIEVSCAAES